MAEGARDEPNDAKGSTTTCYPRAETLARREVTVERCLIGYLVWISFIHNTNFKRWLSSPSYV